MNGVVADDNRSHGGGGGYYSCIFIMPTILCFIVCRIAIVVIDDHLEQYMTYQLL